MKANFKDIIEKNPKVLIDFHATWCGPCKAMSPILEQTKKQLGDDVRILKIDVDKNPELAAKYQVQGVPTLIYFKDGTPAWRQSGVVPAQQIVEAVQK